VHSLVAAIPAAAQQSRAELQVVVKDETGAPVPGVLLKLTNAQGSAGEASTDAAGRCIFLALLPGTYHLHAEKNGFYPPAPLALTLEPGARRSVQITLAHVQEYRERVEVRYTPPPVDPEQTTATGTLTATDVVNLPYSTNRDYRNALPLLPGVVGEPNGQIHVDGSAVAQVDSRLDGFAIAQPVTGNLDLRVSPDAVRQAEVQTARLPSTAARPGGVLELETPMGDDRLRFSATDFIPSFQTRRGLHLESLTPRMTLSGPLRRGRAWFYDAADGEYDLTVIPELPAGADTAPLWRWGNLLKGQVNLTTHHLLSAAIVLNHLRSPRQGLGVFSPLETTTDLSQWAEMGWVKDQIGVARGLLEIGFAYTSYDTAERPRGTAPLVLLPDAEAGNAFQTRHATARRQEVLVQWFPAELSWHGTHRLTLGLDADRVSDHELLERTQIDIERADGTLERQASFTSPLRLARTDPRLGLYAQDGWEPLRGLVVQAGLRVDRDGVLDATAASPRLAASYLIGRSGTTKLTAGVALLDDLPELALLDRTLEGTRQEIFFAADGHTPLGPPVLIQFLPPQHALPLPQVLTWSGGLERMLGPVHLQLDYLARRGRHGLDYQFVPQDTLWAFRLEDRRTDHYDGVRLTAQFSLRNRYPLLVSYTRSRAHSNAVLDPTLASPLFAAQQGGPLPWDTPNRLLSWGWLPLPRRFQLAYTLDWHTGFAFNAVTQAGQLVGAPDRLRFPDFFSLNLHVERRFRLLGFEWALRGGFDNITGRRNPTAVVNSVDSPRFLQFAGIRGRAFTGRIRLLGRH